MRLIRLLVVGILCVRLLPAATQPRPILTTMEEELKRSMEGLGKLETPPYYIGYSVTEIQRNMLNASLGAVTGRDAERTRYLDVDVRVGSHELDNTHPLREDFAFPSFGRVTVPLDDDAEALKAILWLETDKKYKEAVEHLVKVRTNVAVKVKEEDTAGDFTREDPEVWIAETARLDFDEQVWNAKLRALSSLFKAHPEILRSGVTLQVTTINRYMVTSEGTRLQVGQNHVRLSFTGSAKAEDGMDVRSFDSFDGTTLAALPDDETVKKAIRVVVNEVLAMRNAPVVEPFSGPALLSGRAAGVFFHELFGHRIEGHRQKRVEEGQTFAQKIGEKVAPDFISVFSDPTVTSIKGKELNGSYAFDDEGVKARRVTLIENGILRNFLLSRNPVRTFAKSNGHGRSQPGLRVVARQANLLVESQKTAPLTRVREMLIEECKKQGKPFGLFFKEVEGGFTFTGRVTPNMFNVRPVVVYRIYADGRPDELVRGVDMVGTPLMVFGKILATADDLTVFNGFCGAESGAVPVAAVSPSLLISEIEVQKKERSQQRPPLLPPPGAEPKERALDDGTVLQALSDELARSTKQLQMENLERPYFIAYSVHDLETVDLQAQFGSIREKNEDRQRYLKVQVRVGGRDLDNTGFTSRTTAPFRFQPVALDDDYEALRHQVWLATDQAYKSALETLSKKRAHLKNVVSAEAIPDFSEQPPLEYFEKPEPTPPVSTESLERYARVLSAVFRDYPQIQHSSVSLNVRQEKRIYVNSEGSKIVDWRPLVDLKIYAATYSDDGLKSENVLPIAARRFDQLPELQTLEKRVRAIAEDLALFRAAPILDAYTGPVLFSEVAAAELFRELLAPNVAGNRELLSDLPMRTPAGFPGAGTPSQFLARMNARVLPPFLSVVDDPTQKQVQGVPLVGSYVVDDEAVRGQKVALVEKGILKSLLLSRRPLKDFRQSTGHGRASLLSEATATVSNLIVTSEQSKSFEDLKKELIQLCADEGKEFGLMVKLTDLPGIPRDVSTSALFMMAQQGGGTAKGVLAAYKVYADGREEPVRVGPMSGLDIRLLRDIRAASGTQAVYNSLGQASPRSFFSPASFLSGIPFSIAAPAILVEELEFQKPGLGRQKPPYLPHPKARIGQ